MERVLALWRADEAGPSLAIGQRRPDHLRPDCRVHVAELIEHHAIEVDSPQAVRIVGAVDADASAPRKLDPQFTLVDLAARNEPRVLFQIGPGDVLGLI